MKRIDNIQPITNPSIISKNIAKTIEKDNVNVTTNQVKDIVITGEVNKDDITYSAKLNKNIPEVKEIKLPKDPSEYLNSKYLNSLFAENSCLDYECLETTAVYAGDLEEGVENLKWLMKRNPSGEQIRGFISKLCENYPNYKLARNDYLKDNFNLRFDKNNIASFIFPKHSSIINKFKCLKAEHAPDDLAIFKSKLLSKIFTIRLAYENNNLKVCDKIFHFFNDNIEQYIEASKDTIHRTEILRSLQLFISYLKPEYQNQYVSKYYDSLTENLEVAVRLSFTLLENNQYEMTEKLLTGNKSYMDETDKDDVYGNYYHNLAKAKFELDNKSCMADVLCARDCLPEDMDILFTCYQIASKYEMSNRLSRLSKDLNNPSLKTLLEYMVNTTEVDPNKIMDIDEKAIPKAFECTFQTVKFVALQTLLRKNGLIITPDSFRNSLNLFSKRMNDGGIKAAHIAIHFKHYDIAKEIMDKISPKKIARIPALRNMVASLNTNTNSVEIIEKYDISNNEKSELLAKAASSNLANDDNLIAQVHIEEAIKLNEGFDKQLIETAVIASALNEDADKVAHYSELLEAEDITELNGLFAVDKDETDEVANNENQATLDEMDPKKVHAFNQLLKAQNLAQLNTINRRSPGWKIGNEVVDKADTTYLGTYKGMKCYGRINPKLKVNESFDILQSALEEGFVKGTKNVKGVKCIKGRVFELWTKSDLRPRTNLMHVNKDGEVFMDLDYLDDHTGVGAFVRKGKLEFVIDKT